MGRDASGPVETKRRLCIRLLRNGLFRRPVSAQPFARGIDGLLAFFQSTGKEMPDMDHVGPDIEPNIDPVVRRSLGQAAGIVEQGFGAAGLDQHRWQARKIGRQRGDFLAPGIGLAEVEPCHFFQAFAAHHRIQIGMDLQTR